MADELVEAPPLLSSAAATAGATSTAHVFSVAAANSATAYVTASAAARTAAA